MKILCTSTVWNDWKLYNVDVGYNIYRDCYPSELYNMLICDRSTVVNPVLNIAGIFDPIFVETSDKSLMSKKLYQIAY